MTEAFNIDCMEFMATVAGLFRYSNVGGANAELKIHAIGDCYASREDAEAALKGAEQK